MFSHSPKKDSNKTKAVPIKRDKANMLDPNSLQGVLAEPNCLSSSHSVLQLQRMIGNRAVIQLLRSQIQQQDMVQPTQQMDSEKKELQKRHCPIQAVFEDKYIQKQKDLVLESRENNTDIPDNLITGMEHLSGMDLSDIKVHYNSSKPSGLNALAYTQGSDIHVAPGQEKHLPHKAWHVVQQKQKRVKPIQQINDVAINDDKNLEREADVMGEASLRNEISHPVNVIKNQTPNTDVVQRKWEETDSKDTLKWSEPFGGLRWYYNSKNKKMFYIIEKDRDLTEKDKIYLKKSEKQEFTYEEWINAGWNFGGSYRVFAAKSPSDFLTEDPEFYQYFDKENEDEIVVGVLDTGIAAVSKYLADHLKAAGDFSPKGKGPLSGEEYSTYKKSINDFHGTNVAGQAAYGTNNIKIVDIRGQIGQIGVDNSKNIADGIKWAIETHNAKIITSSLDINWSKKDIQKIVRAHPEVLFLTTGANNNTELKKRNIDIDESNPDNPPVENALLVGGVTLDGKKHPSRGYGEAVDVMVPSGSSDDRERALNLHMPTKAMAKLIGQDESWVELVTKEFGDSLIGSDSGVSFGIPVVANIAAKMMLINPKLTVKDIVEILTNIAVRNKGGELGKLSKSKGMVDPLLAYKEAEKRK
ncbi:translation initiation factor 2 [Desulfocucumis palustris]|uniref:Translation initiation factor 2 n=2 Tax=Desulfocucumis palustris TaxID=1898651 RepID=A0A2L2XF49_9FIRM|nr:translation initiation factor 2 [Desulfocucumis palustris]